MTLLIMNPGRRETRNTCTILFENCFEGDDLQDRPIHGNVLVVLN
jgi:hypothetical protein